MTSDRHEDGQEDEPDGEGAADGLSLALEIGRGLAVRQEPLQRLGGPSSRGVRVADQALQDLPVPEPHVSQVAQQDGVDHEPRYRPCAVVECLRDRVERRLLSQAPVREDPGLSARHQSGAGLLLRPPGTFAMALTAPPKIRGLDLGEHVVLGPAGIDHDGGGPAPVQPPDLVRPSMNEVRSLLNLACAAPRRPDVREEARSGRPGTGSSRSSALPVGRAAPPFCFDLEYQAPRTWPARP